MIELLSAKFPCKQGKIQGIPPKRPLEMGSIRRSHLISRWKRVPGQRIEQGIIRELSTVAATVTGLPENRAAGAALPSLV